MSGLLVGLRVLRAEGPRGFAARLLDRFELSRLSRTYRRAALSDLPAGFGCLNLLPVPPSPRFGGVPAQLVARLREESRSRPIALLWRDDDSFRLDLDSGDVRVTCSLPAPARGLPRTEQRETEDVVAEVAGRLGTTILHAEGVAGWPPLSLARLRPRAGALILSLHDFSLFCPRPHLVEEPHGRFCGYSTDPARCGRCLAASWELPAGAIEGWRDAAGRLLAAASAVVFPSEFLRRRHALLFPSWKAGLEVVIPPAVPLNPPAPRAAPRGPVRHVAFVGAYEVHKGARVFEEALGRLDGEVRRSVRFSIYGGGDPALLRRARSLGVKVRGFYGLGSLARLLRRGDVDLALVLSIWPETFAMTLSECRAADVPVLAFAHGAVEERIEAEGGGLLIPFADGAGGLAAALSEVVLGARVPEPFRGSEPSPTPARAAAACLDLYRRLAAGLGTAGEGPAR